MKAKAKRGIDLWELGLQALADQIAADLFTNGNGERAERLLHWSDSKQRNGGGWSEGPAADRILKTLLAAARKGK